MDSREIEQKHIFNPEEKVKRSWDKVVQNLVKNNEAPEQVFTNVASMLYWWRNLTPEKRRDIIQEVEYLVTGNRQEW